MYLQDNHQVSVLETAYFTTKQNWETLYPSTDLIQWPLGYSRGRDFSAMFYDYESAGWQTQKKHFLALDSI